MTSAKITTLVGFFQILTTFFNLILKKKTKHLDNSFIFHTFALVTYPKDKLLRDKTILYFNNLNNLDYESY